MNKKWIQGKIRQNTLIMINQCEAYDKLPRSKTKDDIGKSISLSIAQIESFKDQLDMFDCLYGLTADCPLCHCEDCYAVRRLANGNASR